MTPNDVPEYRVHTKPSPVEHWRHLVEIVALVTAAVWAFYVFVYQERIKPAGELPRFLVSATATHEPLQGGKELVTVNVSLKNVGTNDVAMAALIVNAYGVNYKSNATGAAQEIRAASGVTIVNRGVRGSDPALLYSRLSLWQPLGSTRTLRVPQGEDLPFSEPFVIPRGTYDTLRILYAYCSQRNDDTSASIYQPKRTPDGGFDVQDLMAASGAHAGLRCGGTSYYIGEYAL